MIMETDFAVKLNILEMFRKANTSTSTIETAIERLPISTQEKRGMSIISRGQVANKKSPLSSTIPHIDYIVPPPRRSDFAQEFNPRYLIDYTSFPIEADYLS